MGAKTRATEVRPTNGRPITEPLRRRSGQVSGGVLASIRTLLLPADQWSAISQAFLLRTGRSAEFLDTVPSDSWLPFSIYPALLDAMEQVFGAEQLQQVVRRQVVAADAANLYAGILRSWMRSYGARPDTMVRVVEHIWRATFRAAGQMQVSDLTWDGDGVLLRCDGEAARALEHSPGFAVAMEGLVLGLIDHATPRPTLVEVERQQTDSGVDLVVTWSRN